MTAALIVLGLLAAVGWLAFWCAEDKVADVLLENVHLRIDRDRADARATAAEQSAGFLGRRLREETTPSYDATVLHMLDRQTWPLDERPGHETFDPGTAS